MFNISKPTWRILIRPHQHAASEILITITLITSLVGCLTGCTTVLPTPKQPPLEPRIRLNITVLPDWFDRAEPTDVQS